MKLNFSYRTELFQFSFRTVSNGSVFFLVQVSFWFFCPPQDKTTENYLVSMKWKIENWSLRI